MTRFMDYLRELGIPGFGKKGQKKGQASATVKFGEASS